MSDPLADFGPYPDADLPLEDFFALVAAAKPLWNALEHLGWTDGYGGMEFKRVFPATLRFIHHEANLGPHTDSWLPE